MAWLDETGVETLATELKLKADEMYLPQVLNLLYPVGSIYMSVNSTNPGTLFGGTWVQIQDTFLLAAGSTYTAGDTGGEATHTLTVDEMPNHSHTRYGYYSCGGSGKTCASREKISGDGQSYGVEATGGDQPHNNMPPYLVVYMWKRTE